MTVTAQSNPTGAANGLEQLTLGTPRNGLVTLNGTALPVGNPVSLGGTTTIIFVVTRQVPGQPTTVPLTIRDRCGDWPTFVGGGPGAF